MNDPLKRLYVKQYRLIQTLCGGTGVTDVADVMDITDVTGVMDVTDITGGTVRHMAFKGVGI